MKPNPEEQHWLVRPETIHRIWIAAAILLSASVLLQLLIKVKGYFGIDSWFGFGAAFGFLSCVAMVLLANGLGRFLKRSERYYDD